MPARAIWKAVITFADRSLPVKLYSAVQDRTVHFHLLHDQDMVRLRQRLVNPRTGQAVEYQQARRGAEVEEGVFVILSPEELSQLEPEASRDLQVVCFLDPQVIDHQWYDRPYYLGPDGDETRYFALVEALQRQNREGLVRWVMRRKRYIGALRAERGYLMLITLRYADEVISASALEPPSGREYSTKERGMAEQLIRALEDEFDPSQYHNEYRGQVLQLIESKRKGETVRFEEVPRRRAADSLAAVLQASLRSAKAAS